MDWIACLEALLELEGCPGLEPALVIDYLEQAAEALEHLHSHDPRSCGDVKPANLILTSLGRIVVVDFGPSSRPPTTCAERAPPATWHPESPRGATDRRIGRLLVRRHRADAAHRRTPTTAADLGRDRTRADPRVERIVRANLATDR